MQNLKDIFLKSFSDIKKNIVLFISCILLDILFVFFYGTIRSFFSSVALGPLQKLMTITYSGKTINPFSENAISQVSSTIKDFLIYKSKVLWITIFFIITFTILWSLFQGITWYLSSNIVKKESKLFSKHFLKYYSKFFLVNLFWAGVYTTLGLILLKLALPSGMVVSLNPMQVLILTIGKYIAIGILIFIPISYSLIDKKNVLKETFSIFANNVLLFLTLNIIFVIVFYISIMLQSIFPNTIIKIILGLIISLPLITYYRIVLQKTITQL